VRRRLVARIVVLVLAGTLVACTPHSQTGAGTTPASEEHSPTPSPSASPASATATATGTAGGRIVWTDASFNIVLSNADGSHSHVVVPNHPSVTSPMTYSTPDLSPDGKQIIMDGSRTGAPRSSQLYMVGVDGGTPRRADDAGTIQYLPRWSPDGTQIVYAELEGANGVRDVVRMDADGTGQKVVVGNGDRPSWSPGGGSLVFVSSGNIMVINADGSQLHTLAPGVGPVIWSPDGTEIAFQQTQARGVRVIKADGTSQTVTDAAVSLQSWSPDGRRLLVIATPSGHLPGDLQVIDAASGAVLQTLASNVVDASWQRPR
jgi:Tol biopolymer transport system component